MNDYSIKELSEMGAFECSFEVEVTEQMQKAFAEISGDQNPLHISLEFAKSKGFEEPLVFGMLTASFYSRLVGVYMPGLHSLFHELKASFIKPVYVGDKLTVSGRLEEVQAEYCRVVVKAAIHNQRGEKVSKATITAGVTR
ncbi:MAG: MaoC family dehydratase N-terminal domain-containing protein [Clostridiales bacterium]|jgi:3-hydroxybutyryl-CoA dehydratase|nr:MaoC family dehydratase N-terminal domain-containing protein [Clostridiales bacterium]MDR2751087.1 MaoC family dehydratase N-terminal domain-containing protein [Clostridiales bacterium]